MPGTSVKDAIKKFEELLATNRGIYETHPEKIGDYDPLLLVEANKGCETPADCKKVRNRQNPRSTVTLVLLHAFMPFVEVVAAAKSCEMQRTV